MISFGFDGLYTTSIALGPVARMIRQNFQLRFLYLETFRSIIVLLKYRSKESQLRKPEMTSQINFQGSKSNRRLKI